MARVPTGGSRRAAEATLNRPRAVRKQKEYKVVLEAVTEKKRKLHSVLTFQDQAPLGFGFIPVGFGQVTEWCKEQCRQRGKEVHIVSAAPKNANFNRADPEKISSHVHRIGHHFPLDIIELACRKFGYRFSPYNGLEKIESQAQTQKYGVDYFERRLAAYYKKQQLSGFDDDTETKSYISGAIRELFPKIPQADLTSIVNHAFKEGTDRVGNAPELSLARRVQLAVVAHIRHTYTDYDEILKKESWIEARQKVELPSLAKLKEWRDEDDEDSNEMEETFREIIVIDDNEDESSVIASTSRDPNVEERELSMEIVSSRATARDLQPEPVDRHQRYAPYSSREPTRTIFLAPMHSRPPLARPFTHPAERPSYFASSPVTYAAPRASVAGPPVDARPPPPFGADEPPRLGPDPVHYAPTRHVDSYVPVMHFASPSDPGRSIREPARAPRPTQVRGSDGRVYILQPIQEPRYHAREPAQNSSRVLPTESDYYSRSALAPSLKRPAPVIDSPRPSVSRRTSEQDMVLPSIEQEAGRPFPLPHQHGRDPNSNGHAYSAKGYPGYESHQDNVPRHRVSELVDAYRQPRMQHWDEVIIPTSPTRPLNGVPSRPPRIPSGPNNHYVLAPSRTSPPHEARDAYYESPRKMTRAHVPDDRIYNGRIPQGRLAFAEEVPTFRSDRDRDLGDSPDYGAHGRYKSAARHY